MKQAEIDAEQDEEEQGDDDEEDDEDDNNSDKGKKVSNQEAEENDYKGPVGAADGSSGSKVNKNIWAANEEEGTIELSEEMIGELAGDAKQEALLAASKSNRGGAGAEEVTKGPPGKRVRKH